MDVALGLAILAAPLVAIWVMRRVLVRRWRPHEPQPDTPPTPDQLKQNAALKRWRMFATAGAVGLTALYVLGLGIASLSPLQYAPADQADLPSIGSPSASPAAPPSGGAPAPNEPPSPTILNTAIRDVMRPLSSVFFAPTPVARDESFEATLRVSPPGKTLAELAQDLREEAGRSGVTASGAIQLQPLYTASLTPSEDVPIRLQGEASRVFEGQEITWRWYVGPVTKGPLELTVMLSTPVRRNGELGGIDIVSFKETVSVSVSRWQHATDGWNWITEHWAPIAGLATLVGFVWVRARRKPAPEPPPVVASSQRILKVLFLAADPFKTNALSLDEEVRQIQQRIDASRQRRVELITSWAVRPGDLQGLLLKHDPDIVHFSGHGTDAKSLVFQGDDGQPREVSSEALVNLFEILAGRVDVVVLNACHSFHEAKAMAAFVDFAIGMSTAIGDEAAVEFAAAFYGALAADESVRTAFALARNAIDLADLDEAETPQLYARHETGPRSDLKPLEHTPGS